MADQRVEILISEEKSDLWLSSDHNAQRWLSDRARDRSGKPTFPAGRPVSAEVRSVRTCSVPPPSRSYGGKPDPIDVELAEQQ